MPLKVVPRRDRKLHRLVKKAPLLTLRKGEALYRFGDTGEEVFLVRTGHILLTEGTARPQARVVALAGPWELTGDEALVPGTPRRTGAVAGEASQVSLLRGKGVSNALRTASRTYGAYLLAKEEELALARTLAGPRRDGATARRLAALLLDLSRRLGRTETKGGGKAKGGEKVEIQARETGGRTIPLRLTHQVLADLAGCHRSTATTFLNDWIYQGILIQDRGRLQILRPERLEPRSDTSP